jgi:SAM-dependent methyltransferase
LLETACGTGRFLEYFAKHFRVEGHDLSPQMRERAARRLPGVPLHLGDMVELSLPSRYDVVCCLFRSIAYVRTLGRFEQTVTRMADHLTPGGLVVIEPFFTPNTFWDAHVVLNEFQGEDMKVAWMSVSEKRSQRLGAFHIHCLVGTPRGVRHFEEVHELGLFAFEDYATAFARAGLELIQDAVGPTGIGLYLGKKI